MHSLPSSQLGLGVEHLALPSEQGDELGLKTLAEQDVEYYQVPMTTTPIAILLSSWPGLTRPSTLRRWCADGRVKPGQDDNG
jgi:hypothetical protein